VGLVGASLPIGRSESIGAADAKYGRLYLGSACAVLLLRPGAEAWYYGGVLVRFGTRSNLKCFNLASCGALRASSLVRLPW